ncbi:MAG: MBL fold metallo-hydrolase [Thermodesulfobacteriota bacterium]
MIQKTGNLYQLSDSVYGFVFPQYEDLGNAGIVITDEGVVIIDTDVRSVDILFSTLPQITQKEIKFLINSHHAFDHSSANCDFAKKGIPIIGSEKCREAMIHHGELNFKRWSNREPYIKKILEERGTTVSLPHITFDHGLKLNLGGETIELSYYGHAHTPGDIVIYLPKDQILFAGDLLWTGFFPNVREANVPNQIEAVNRILEFPVKYYIPGHGHITSDRNEVIRMRDYLENLYETLSRLVKEGKSLEEIRPIEIQFAKDHPDWQGKRFLKTAIEVLYQSLT